MMTVVGDDAVQEVIEAELALLQPNVRADPAQLEALLDHDFVEFGASGRRWERADIIADLVSQPALDVVVTEMTARRIVDRVVVVMYVTVSNERRVRRSSWWRETDGRWRCCFHQGTVESADE